MQSDEQQFVQMLWIQHCTKISHNVTSCTGTAFSLILWCWYSQHKCLRQYRVRVVLPRWGSYYRREESGPPRSGVINVVVGRRLSHRRQIDEVVTTEIVDGRRASVAGRSTGPSRSGTVDLADGRRSVEQQEPTVPFLGDNSSTV